MEMRDILVPGIALGFGGLLYGYARFITWQARRGRIASASVSTPAE